MFIGFPFFVNMLFLSVAVATIECSVIMVGHVKILHQSPRGMNAKLLCWFMADVSVVVGRKRRGAVNAKQLAYLARYRPKSRLKMKQTCTIM